MVLLIGKRWTSQNWGGYIPHLVGQLFVYQLLLLGDFNDKVLGSDITKITDGHVIGNRNERREWPIEFWQEENLSEDCKLGNHHQIKDCEKQKFYISPPFF